MVTLVKSFVPVPDMTMLVNVIIAEDAGVSVNRLPLPIKFAPLMDMLVL